MAQVGRPIRLMRLFLSYRYKIGDAFYHVKLEQAQEMLEKASERIDKDVARLEDDISSIRDQMAQLKVELYARFGKSINLEK